MAEFVPLISEEEGNDTAWYIAGAAGIGSGLFKVPEGIFSLAAELIDLGLDTNLAGKVEQAFDFINHWNKTLVDPRYQWMNLDGEFFNNYTIGSSLSQHVYLVHLYKINLS